MSWLQMVDMDIQQSEKTPVVCSKSFWTFSKHGGLLHVIPEVGEVVSCVHIVRSILGFKKTMSSLAFEAFLEISLLLTLPQ
jgi:hypothetical protein